MTLVPIVDSSQLSKRKRSEAGSDNENSDAEPPEPEDEDADGEEDYTAPRLSQLKKKQVETNAAITPATKPAAKRGRGRPPGPGKPRAPKATTIAGAKPRKARARKGAGEFDAEQVARDTKIANDNPLFSEYCLLFSQLRSNLNCLRCCHESFCRTPVHGGRLPRITFTNHERVSGRTSHMHHARLWMQRDH